MTHDAIWLIRLEMKGAAHHAGLVNGVHGLVWDSAEEYVLLLTLDVLKSCMG